MVMTDYVVLDVFTDRPFSGNPLAVILEAAALPEEALQPIAREFGFSETTFVYPPQDLVNTARVRIFTPLAEIPFAGHPTIGTAVALAARGAPSEMVLELGVGPVEAHAVGGHARFTTRHPLTRLGAPDPALAAACTGLAVSDFAVPLVIASVGLPFVLAEVTNVEALASARVQTDAFRRADERHGKEAGGFNLYLYVRDGAEIRARLFAPLHGIVEDPATGSAAAALSAHLADLEGGTARFSITQGVEMGRPSRIEVAVERGAITVAGEAVEVMRGTLTAVKP
jgi:trans-2,3-dihydro-3-hydroxyanthranilate isomerase